MTKISNQYSLTNILTADLANSRLGINNVSPTVALDVTGAGKFSGASLIVGSAVATTNVKLFLNGVASKAASIEFQQSGVTQWYLGNGAASEDNNFELYNSNGTMAMKIIKSTNAIAFTGAATFSSSVTLSSTASTPSYGSSSVGINLGYTNLQNVVGSQACFANNVFYDGANWKSIANTIYAQAVRFQSGFIDFHIAPVSGANANMPNWDSTDKKMVIGYLGFTASTRTASDSESKTFMNSLSVTCGLIPVPSGTTLYLYSRDSSTNYRALLTSSTYFTGQHGNKPVDLDLKNNIENYIGMIVSSAGTYYSVNPITKEVTTGKDAISISEALPEIKLTNIDKDKSVWGVVTNVKNDNYNTDGTVETDNNTEWGDRLGSNVIRINGLGEGAIWVTNINGNIENGDYICSSIIPGLGRKQDDDMLRNYSVAKITMDCDFDLNNNNLYKCEEFEFQGKIYKKAFVGCTYHCS